MDPSAVDFLTDANESLKNEIWDLRETAVNLDTEKQEIISENKSMAEQNRNLEAKISCFKAMADELQKEEKELQVMLRQLEDTIAQLEAQNQTLNGTNQGLRTEIQKMSSHIFLFQDYKEMQDQDVSLMKEVMEHIVAYFKQLEMKIEMAEQRDNEEENEAAELKHTLDELEQIREVQENEIACLRGQLKEASLLRPGISESTKFPSLLHEMVQAKLVQESLSVHSSLLLLLSKATWLLLGMVVCLWFLNLSIELYLFLFGHDVEVGSPRLFSPDYLSLLTDVLSLHRTRKPSGLLPF